MIFSLIKEFKEFAIKGNMIDISIGVIIGSAFNKVVGIYRSLIKVRRINLKASDNSTTFDLVKISLEIYYR